MPSWFPSKFFKVLCRPHGITGMLLAVLLFHGFAAAEDAAPSKDSVTVDTSKGYARLLFSFTTPTSISASIADGVLTIRVARPPSTSVETLVSALPRYVTSGRADDEGKALRFALSNPMALHSSTV